MGFAGVAMGFGGVAAGFGGVAAGFGGCGFCVSGLGAGGGGFGIRVMVCTATFCGERVCFFCAGFLFMRMRASRWARTIKRVRRKGRTVLLRF